MTTFGTGKRNPTFSAEVELSRIIELAVDTAHEKALGLFAAVVAPVMWYRDLSLEEWGSLSSKKSKNARGYNLRAEGFLFCASVGKALQRCIKELCHGGRTIHE